MGLNATLDASRDTSGACASEGMRGDQVIEPRGVERPQVRK